MVYVQLAREWTDGGGAAHAVGDMVDVDAVTLAQLEADGVVASTEKSGATVPTGWAGETGADPAWAGETGVQP
ncbi:MAG: hypothetical protein JWP76_5950 [Dactylosporangium sp.]|jgi:hypothetical protein|nr:hypothetical protein [Dactylosporangium sp.]